MKLTKGLIRADIIAARQAIAYYDEKQIKDIKNIAAYHLQQSAEKLIKIQLYRGISQTSNKEIYTHDLRRLVGYANAQGLTLAGPEYIQRHLLMITDWEAGSRYNIGFSVRIDILKKTLDIITEWERQIR